MAILARVVVLSIWGGKYPLNSSINLSSMIIDSEKMSFFLTEKRKEKLKNVRQMILQSKKVPVAVIQKFTINLSSMYRRHDTDNCRNREMACKFNV
jgi:uncharacterized membrane protein YhiD involved in acid resistance